MKKPHVHAECIIAWANGAEIQFLGDLSGTWMDCTPSWQSHIQYRIKPEPKPDCRIPLHILRLESGGVILSGRYPENVIATFDGETGKLKSVEMMK